jgi:Icc-related predicted phosphoesterase
MKLHILSDLHNEFSTFKPPSTKADVVVLAGDIHNHENGVTWAAATFQKPVLYVAGNHEFYGNDIATLPASLKSAAEGTNVIVLDNDVAVIDGVRFLGTTLWTDFELTAADTAERDKAMKVAELLMSDYRVVANGGKRLKAVDTSERFKTAIQFLREELLRPFDGQTVVITHHAPSSKSIHPRYVGNAINGAFASNLEGLCALGTKPPTLWIHGHTHDSFDYRVRDTRVVANPRGYTRRHTPDWPENNGFDRALIMEI